jgi:hypothetical protein
LAVCLTINAIGTKGCQNKSSRVAASSLTVYCSYLIALNVVGKMRRRP